MPRVPGASNAARSANIATEIRAGKPRAQAIAIGYSEQREARKKRLSNEATALGVKGKR